MKKIFLTLLIGAIFTSSCFISASAITMDNNYTYKINSIYNNDESFKISSTSVDQTTGKTTINIKFDKEISNTTLLIRGDSQTIYQKDIVSPTKELSVDVQLPYYGGVSVTAYLGDFSKPYDKFDYSVKSNSLKLGYFNPQRKENIALTYSNSSNQDTNFKAILPIKDYNTFFKVYDNGVLVYSIKLIRPTDIVEFSLPITSKGKHDIRAYVGLSQGEYQFDPYQSSNAVIIFK